MNLKRLFLGLAIGFILQPAYAAYVGIHAVAAAGDVAGLKQYLADNPKLISARNGPNRTPLCIAVMCGQTNAVEFLLAQGGDVNDRGFQEMTPLADMASAWGQHDDDKCAGMAQILIAHGAAVDPLDYYQKTPLLWAVESQKPKLARVLLEHGASQTNTFTGTYARLTPLQFALKHGDMDMVAMLLEFKPPLEAVDSDGNTPLLWAAKFKKLEAARQLLAHGASLASTNWTESSFLTPASYGAGTRANVGRTPLHWAVLNADADMVVLLLAFHPPLDRADDDGATPLFLAQGSQQTNLVALLLQAAPASAQGWPPAVPTHEAMRAIAQRIVDGDAGAFGELITTSADMYRDINYQEDHARVRLNYSRMRDAFDLLGEQAGKGKDNAFQALKQSLGVPSLKSFAPVALGTAAAAGHQESLNLLLHYDQWGMHPASACEALVAPARTNVQPAVDFLAAVLTGPVEVNHSLFGFATEGLQGAAANGNQQAKVALDKYAAATAPQQ